MLSSLGLLSILVPLYNEEEFIGPLLDRVLAASLPDGLAREIIVVDDCSTDGSAEIASAKALEHPDVIQVLHHGRNQGKGAAIRTAIEAAKGEISIIQDADLEYDPNEYERLVTPILDKNADAVYGSRFMNAGARRVLLYWHTVANWFLTGLCNMVSGLNLTDMETCYKAFRTSLLRSIPIRSNRFGIEPEITIKLARREVRIYEVPISYHGRGYEEGKKIGLWDAIEAVFVILRYSFTKDIYTGAGPEILDVLSSARRFNHWMAETIQPYVGKRVLEIGAGIGNLTRHLVARREWYVATDIEEEHLARLRTRFHHRSNLQVCACDLTRPEDFTRFGETMDSVVCLNVLEHVEDDLQGLRNIHSVLKPGGRAIVLVPHGQEIFGALDIALGHYRRYRHAELQERMEATGFSVDRIIEFNRITRPGWYLNGKILKRKTLSHVQLRIFDRFVWLWRRIDSYLPWAPTSIIAIGVKKGRS